MTSQFLEEKYLHLAFEVTLILKAVFAVAETLAGIGAYFVTQQLLFRLVDRITREELLEDPRDFIANYLFQSAQHFSVSTRNFTAVYLLSHGVIKLWLIIGLLRQRLLVLPGRDRDFRTVHRLPAVPIQSYALALAALHHRGGCRRDRSYLARVPLPQALAPFSESSMSMCLCRAAPQHSLKPPRVATPRGRCTNLVNRHA